MEAPAAGGGDEVHNLAIFRKVPASSRNFPQFIAIGIGQSTTIPSPLLGMSVVRSELRGCPEMHKAGAQHGGTEESTTQIFAYNLARCIFISDTGDD